MTRQEEADILQISIHTLRRWKERPEFPKDGTIEEKIAYAIANKSTKGQKRGAPTIKPPPPRKKGEPLGKNKTNGKTKPRKQTETEKQLQKQMLIDAKLSTRIKTAQAVKLEANNEKVRKEIIEEARTELIREARNFFSGLKAALRKDKKYTKREIIEIINQLRGK